MPLVKLILFVLSGFLVARFAGIEGLENNGWYMVLVATLLGIGLYVSTFGIDLKEAREHLKIIVSAVTVGVVLKAALIGGSLALLFQDPFFLILGITVAQIDPLSVAHLMKGSRMSSKAKTILASWASFDDPITVILCLYAPLFVAGLTGVDFGSIAGNADMGGFTAYVREFSFNLLLAGAALALWWVIRAYSRSKKGKTMALLLAGGTHVLLVVVFSISVAHFLMLALALIGLFLRPPALSGKILDGAVVWALRAAAVLLGLLLVGGVDLWKGVALGMAAYFAQVAVGLLLTRGLPAKDRLHISFAQQNGITAIILALLFEVMHPGTVAIVAPAIIVINGIHWIANKVVDRKNKYVGYT